jgi:hypothetical protein
VAPEYWQGEALGIMPTFRIRMALIAMTLICRNEIVYGYLTTAKNLSSIVLRKFAHNVATPGATRLSARGIAPCHVRQG